MIRFRLGRHRYEAYADRIHWHFGHYVYRAGRLHVFCIGPLSLSFARYGTKP